MDVSTSACAPFREVMLEADPPELRGEGDGPLARHLRTCPSCARVAALLLEETAHLDAYLTEAPRPDVDALLRRAGFSVGAPPAPTSGPRFASRMWRFPTRRVWIPVAAAAALTAILLLRAPEVHTPAASVGSVATSVPRATPPVVEPAAGQDAAIMQTDDPNITVVWLFKTG